MKPVPYHWDESKIGPGATPIRTGRGWLSIYHGVFETMDGGVYRLGVALHDLANPAKIIGVSDEWVLAPEDPWEITGYEDLLGWRGHRDVRRDRAPRRPGRSVPQQQPATVLN